MEVGGKGALLMIKILGICVAVRRNSSKVGIGDVGGGSRCCGDGKSDCLRSNELVGCGPWKAVLHQAKAEKNESWAASSKCLKLHNFSKEQVEIAKAKLCGESSGVFALPQPPSHRKAVPRGILNTLAYGGRLPACGRGRFHWPGAACG